MTDVPDLERLASGLPPEFTSRYRLEEVLGRGGQGLAVRARQLRLNRQVVVKFLLAAETIEIRRFLLEAELLSRIRHPNVVRLYDFGAVPAGPFLVLELLTGASLASRVADVSLEEIALIGLDLFAGLEAVHDIGVIHRDIKPANVHLGGDGTAKLLDFGIAREEKGTRLTGDGIFVGTPAYASPELLSGEEVGGRSDLYSVGVMLLELLTGVNPFHAHQLSEIVDRHYTLEVTKITGARLPVPRPLENLIVALLQKDPRNRPASAAEAFGLMERAVPAARVTRGARVIPEISSESVEIVRRSASAVRAAASAATAATAVSGIASRPVRREPGPLPGWTRRMRLPALVGGGVLLAFLVIGGSSRRSPVTPGAVATLSPLAPSAGTSLLPSPVADAATFVRETAATMRELRKSYEAEQERCLGRGLDFQAIEPDDFRVPSVTPLFEAVGMAPAAIRAGRKGDLELEPWIPLFLEIHHSLALAGGLASSVLKEKEGEKYLEKPAVRSRAASRARDCVHAATPIVEALEEVAPAGAGGPAEAAFALFRRHTRIEIDQTFSFMALAQRTDPAAPAWVRVYIPPNHGESGDRLLPLVDAFATLPPAWSIRPRILEYRIDILQESGRFHGRTLDGVESMFELPEVVAHRRRMAHELHRRSVETARSWLEIRPPAEIHESRVVGLAWRLLLPSPPGEEDLDLAAAVLDRLPRAPEKLDFAAIRAPSDPGLGEALTPLAARLDPRRRAIVEAIIALGEAKR